MKTLSLLILRTIFFQNLSSFPINRLKSGEIFFKPISLFVAVFSVKKLWQPLYIWYLIRKWVFKMKTSVWWIRAILSPETKYWNGSTTCFKYSLHDTAQSYQNRTTGFRSCLLPDHRCHPSWQNAHEQDQLESQKLIRVYKQLHTTTRFFQQDRHQKACWRIYVLIKC